MSENDAERIGKEILKRAQQLREVILHALGMGTTTGFCPDIVYVVNSALSNTGFQLVPVTATAVFKTAEQPQELLTLRFEHEAGSKELYTIAPLLCRYANALRVIAICNINQWGDMFAFPDELPDQVYARWYNAYGRQHF